MRGILFRVSISGLVMLYFLAQSPLSNVDAFLPWNHQIMIINLFHHNYVFMLLVMFFLFCYVEGFKVTIKSLFPMITMNSWIHCQQFTRFFFYVVIFFVCLLFLLQFPTRDKNREFMILNPFFFVVVVVKKFDSLYYFAIIPVR